MAESDTQAQAADLEGAASVTDVASAIPATPGIRLAKLAMVHILVVLLSLSAFAAADSWLTVSGLGIAALLGVVTGALAGIAVTNLVHEWFHFLGAVVAGGRYTVPDKFGLFVYDWDFEHNNIRQFNVMSVAGNLGGVLAILYLWNAVPAENLGRAALQGGAIASFVFGAFIEWPVLYRTRSSGRLFDELAKINGKVLGRSFVAALVAGLVVLVSLAP